MAASGLYPFTLSLSPGEWMEAAYPLAFASD